jgi:hypothetical protein
MTKEQETDRRTGNMETDRKTDRNRKEDGHCKDQVNQQD